MTNINAKFLFGSVLVSVPVSRYVYVRLIADPHSGAFPQHYGQVASKEQVENVLRFVGYLKAKSLAHNHMPIDAELLVHVFLDDFGGVLVMDIKLKVRLIQKLIWFFEFKCYLFEQIFNLITSIF